MSYESCDVYVVDQSALALPVPGVLVRVFDATNRVFHTQAVTDASGRAGFTLYIGTYQLRFYKFGAQVEQPQLVEVTVPPQGKPLTNAFTVRAVVFQPPISNDPRLCRASGYFRDITGASQPNLDIQIIGQFQPILLEGAAVLSERRALRTDGDGFACVDLIRCARYTATLEGMEDTQRCVEVPDAPSANLPDLLFPVVEQVTLTPAAPYAMRVGARLELTPVVVASSGVPLVGTATADVVWSSSDTTVLDVGVTATTLVLTAKARGTAELRATRLNNTIVRVPNTAIRGVPQTITVT